MCDLEVFYKSVSLKVNCQIKKTPNQKVPKIIKKTVSQDWHMNFVAVLEKYS